MTTLLLIRHGTNDWVHGRLAGWTPGVHLNDEGRKQAESLAIRLAPIPLDAIYASPLERTIETARAVATPRGMPIHLVDNIGEVKYGEWQGAELKELYKHELWPGVQFYPSGTRFPGGETLGEAQNRAVAALDALRARHPKGIIAVFSHADLIKLVLAYYIGMHIDLFQRLEVQPCSLSALIFTRMGPRLVTYNDTGTLEHLKPKPEPPAEAATPEEPSSDAAKTDEQSVEPAQNSDEHATQHADEASAASNGTAPDSAPAETNGVATEHAAASAPAAQEEPIH